jgi:hypothetical protein
LEQPVLLVLPAMMVQLVQLVRLAPMHCGISLVNITMVLIIIRVMS